MEFLLGLCRSDPFSDQKRSFQFDTVFQTWPLKSIPVFRPGLYEIRSSLLRVRTTTRWKRMNEATDMEKEICIAEVIASNAGYQRFTSCAPWSDRNNKNPSSDLLVLL